MQRFTFCGEVLRSVSELVFDEVVKGPDISAIHTIYPNIVTQRQIGFVGKGGLVGVAHGKCEPEPQGWSINTRAVTFDPRAWEVLVEACYADLEATAAVYSLNKGVDIADFTDTDYAALLLEVLSNSMSEFVYRLAWFGDVDAKNVADAGQITNGVDVKYFTLLDGFFKQLDARVALNPAQRVAISENARATYAEQAITSSNALEYLRKAYRAAPVQLRGLRNKIFLVTQSVYDAYAESLQSSCCIDATYQNLVNGMPTLLFNGIPVMAMPVWDEILASYFNDSAAGRAYNPHRIVLTSPDVLALGVDTPDAFDNVNTWYNRDSRKVKIEAMGKMDVKLANPSLFVYGV